MCGICGVFNFHREPVDGGLIDRMSSIIRHRGPDGAGSYVSGEIGLGHRRLSIIDLGGELNP
jgi:asparagine synthase (glutamine-hydrolysing)